MTQSFNHPQLFFSPPSSSPQFLCLLSLARLIFFSLFFFLSPSLSLSLSRSPSRSLLQPAPLLFLLPSLTIFLSRAFTSPFSFLFISVFLCQPSRERETEGEERRETERASIPFCTIGRKTETDLPVGHAQHERLGGFAQYGLESRIVAHGCRLQCGALRRDALAHTGTQRMHLLYHVGQHAAVERKTSDGR